MLTVYAFGGAWDAMDLSPFVTKLLTWLRMTGVEHRTEVGDVRKAPHRKLPYVDDGGRILGDSSIIIEHLRASGRGRPLAGDDLTPVQAAVATAFKGMIESELYFVILYSRWTEEAGFALYRPVLNKAITKMGIPSLLAPVLVRVLRRQMVAQAYDQGIGRHEGRVVFAKGRQHIDAISAYLGDKPYFMGDEPGTIDATVFGFVDSLTNNPLCRPLTEHVQQHPNLVRYRARMRERYWADRVSGA